MTRLDRPLLGLSPYFGRSLAHFAAACSYLVLGILVPPILLLAFWAGRRTISEFRWFWKFGKRVRHFRTVSNDRVRLYYEPELEDKWIIAILLDNIQAELETLSQQFGLTFRHRVNVYCFEHLSNLCGFVGPQHGGMALPHANAIVIPDDYGNIREIIRHELAHLFSHRWSSQAPPFLFEGLSVHMQRTMGTCSIDMIARQYVGQHEPPPSWLLDRRVFFSEANSAACYALAGSFTGYLIRRYGWKNYRRLFRWCDGTMFHFKFRWCFGVSLEQAESNWRDELRRPRCAVSFSHFDFGCRMGR